MRIFNFIDMATKRLHFYNVDGKIYHENKIIITAYVASDGDVMNECDLKWSDALSELQVLDIISNIDTILKKHPS